MVCVFKPSLPLSTLELELAVTVTALQALPQESFVNPLYKFDEQVPSEYPRNNTLEANRRYLAELSEGMNLAHDYILTCKWPVIISSMTFVTLLCWEMVGDHYGWYGASWVPSVGLGMIVLLWLLNRIFIRWSPIPLPALLVVSK